MLGRYRKDSQIQPVPAAVIDSAGEDIKQSWDMLGEIIKQGEDMIAKGGLPRVQDIIAAVKLRDDMYKDLGIAQSLDSGQKAKAMLNRLVEDIILPRLTEEQRQDIIAAIGEDDELAGWILLEGEA